MLRWVWERVGRDRRHGRLGVGSGGRYSGDPGRAKGLTRMNIFVSVSVGVPEACYDRGEFFFPSEALHFKSSTPNPQTCKPDGPGYTTNDMYSFSERGPVKPLRSLCGVSPNRDCSPKIGLKTL